MLDEQAGQQPRLKPAEVFGLTEAEELAYRVSDERLQAILDDEATTIHMVWEDENNYGEFLFLTASREAPQGPVLVTFYGLGNHELREQWITGEWYWYESHPAQQVLERTATRMEAAELIRERRRDIEPYITDEQPSARARLYSALADLTDEDAAQTELEDLEGMGWPLDDES